jgi:hypothetical protein
MSDLLATVLGLGFTLVVCLLAVQALLSPWLRVRRRSGLTQSTPAGSTSSRATRTPETSAGASISEATAQVG